MTQPMTPTSRPKGLLKWAFTLPLYLYRWHLGWLVGHSYLMLTHLGRKTGRMRQTGVEVARYDPATQECIVVAAWGERTDWYRNIQAHPALEVQVGSKHYPPIQRFLTFEETWALLSDYRRHHPRRLRLLLHLLAGYPYRGSREELREVAQVVRCVAFRPPQLGESV
jgi:deazaflavin-dependent oxidoreductase (nitroreductase family)